MTLIAIGGAEDKSGDMVIHRRLLAEARGAATRVCVITTATSDPEDTRQRTFRVPYRTPQDGQQHHIVIQVEDSEGTHTGYDNMHGPGQTVATEISGVGRPIIIKLYDNDDLKAQTLAVKGR